MELELVFACPQELFIGHCPKPDDNKFDVCRTVHRNIRISIVKQLEAEYLKFILFWNNTLHVSDGLSVRHQ